MRRALLLAFALSVLVAHDAAAQIDVKCFAPALTDCGGIWHRTSVRIDWTVVPPFVAVDCSDETLTRDTVGTQRGCLAETQDGQTATRGVTVKIDATAPVVTGASASRPPDANGWYRSPVQVAFAGTDATSGLLGCTTATFAGPDGAGSVSGTCRDVAGNQSAPSAFGLRFDATPPSLAGVRASAGDDVVRLRWNVPDATAVEVWRSPGRGDAERSLLQTGAEGRVKDDRVRNGRRYDYRVRAVDEAGNAADRVLSLVPGPHLIAPAAGAQVESAPLLRWTPVRGARYYNVQLLRGDRKVLSAWPTRARLQLERAWRFDGHRRRLRAGRYRWLVWPGRGPRAESDYGPLIGARAFTVPSGP